MAMAFPGAVCLCEQMREALVGKESTEVEVLDITKLVRSIEPSDARVLRIREGRSGTTLVRKAEWPGTVLDSSRTGLL